MSVGGQAQSGNQSGSQSSQQSGTNNTTTDSTGRTVQAGTQTGQTSGTQTGQTAGTQTGQTSGQTAGQNTVQTTDGWKSVSDMLRGMVSGSGGLTPQQLAAMGIITDSANNTANAMDYGGKVLSQYVGDNHPAYQVASADKIVAPSGAAFIGDYQAPVDAAVAATRNDLTHGLDTALNELNAKYGGAMGNGREGVAASGAVDNFIRSLDNSSSSMRLNAFGKQVDAGQADAGRQLQANTGNVGNKMVIDQFNTGQKNLNDQQSIGVVNDWIAQQQAKNGVVAGAANTNAGISQTGVGNVGGYLSSQTPAFGNSNTGTQTGSQSGSQSGTQSGSSSGSSSGTTNNTTDTTMQQIINSIFSGQSSGTSSGNSSSKGGGMSIPILPH